MLDSNHNSNHIEGNTQAYGQTGELLLPDEVLGDARMKRLAVSKQRNWNCDALEHSQVHGL